MSAPGASGTWPARYATPLWMTASDMRSPASMRWIMLRFSVFLRRGGNDTPSGPPRGAGSRRFRLHRPFDAGEVAGGHGIAHRPGLQGHQHVPAHAVLPRARNGTRLREHRLEQPEAAGVGIHLDQAAHRHDELPRDVADHRASVGRDAQRPDVVLHDLAHGQRTVAVAGLAVRALAEI